MVGIALPHLVYRFLKDKPCLYSNNFTDNKNAKRDIRTIKYKVMEAEQAQLHLVLLNMIP